MVLFEKTGLTAKNLGEAKSKRKIIVNKHEDGIRITSSTTGAWWATHELGHAFNFALHPNTTDNLNFGQGIIDLALQGIYVNDDERIAGNLTQS